MTAPTHEKTPTFGDRAPRTLDELPATGHVRVQHTPRGVRKPHLRPPTTLLLEIPAHTRKRAARARRTHEPIDLAPHLRPYLRARRLIVRARIRRIVKLVRPYRIVQPPRVHARLVVVVARVLKRDGRDGVHLGAEHAQQIDLLLALHPALSTRRGQRAGRLTCVLGMKMTQL